MAKVLPIPAELPQSRNQKGSQRLELDPYHPLFSLIASNFLFEGHHFNDRGNRMYPLDKSNVTPKYGADAGNYCLTCGGAASDEAIEFSAVVEDLFPQGRDAGYTIACLVYVKAIDTRGGILQCPTDPGGGQAIHVMVEGGQFRHGSKNFSTNTARIDLTFNKWHHVVCTYDGTSLGTTRIFVDGEEGSTAAEFTSISNSSTITSIGNAFESFNREFDGNIACLYTMRRTLGVNEARRLSRDVLQVYRSKVNPFYIAGAEVGPSAGLSGSATLGINGNDIRLGGKQIIITLSNDTWVAGASFDAQRQAIIDGLDAATTPTNGWNNEVRDNLPVTSVVRVNPTIVNVNLNAQPGYNVFAQEVITSTIPAAALVTSVSDLTATPTFTVDPGDKGPATPDTFNEVTPQDTQLSASVGTVTDPDGLAAIPFNVSGPNEPDNGTLTNFNNTTGDYLYDPNPSYVGPDQFIVTVTDLKGFTSSVTVNIDVQASASAAVEGTVVPTANESEIVTGGEVIDIRLTGDEWIAAGPTFDAVRQDIINGLNSDGVELTGWNNEVRDKEVVTAVNRASNTLVRITLSPSAAYAIDNSETITVTVPAVALVTTTTDFDASPTFSIIPEAVSGVAPGGLQGPGQQVMPNAVTRLGGVVDE